MTKKGWVAVAVRLHNDAHSDQIPVGVRYRRTLHACELFRMVTGRAEFPNAEFLPKRLADNFFSRRVSIKDFGAGDQCCRQKSSPNAVNCPTESLILVAAACVSASAASMPKDPGGPAEMLGAECSIPQKKKALFLAFHPSAVVRERTKASSQSHFGFEVHQA